jgi:hypothetical protein
MKSLIRVESILRGISTRDGYERPSIVLTKETFKLHTRNASWVLASCSLKNLKHIGNPILVGTPCWTLDWATENDTTQSRFPIFLTDALPTTPGGAGHDH